jgi:glucose/arabinose dehydrogenase
MASRNDTTRIEPLEPRQMLAANLPDGFEEQRIITGLDEPTAMAFAPDGRILVTEKSGDVRVVKNGNLLSTPALSLRVDTYFERGLDGIVLDPEFEDNGFVYLYYTTREPRNRLSRFTMRNDTIDADSERILIDNISAANGNHNGGSLQFGRDGMLYVGVGDAGNERNSQNLNNLNGKILRINPDAYPNVVPGDNPFAGQSNRRGEIWAYGLRNPFTSAMKPGTNKLYVNDVGQSDFEEVNRIVKGGNYGWPDSEGRSNDPDHEDPIYTYAWNGSAITGGVFYSGDQFPVEYRGKYLVSDYLRQFIRVIDADGDATNFATGVDSPLDLDIGPDGSLYYLSYGEGGAGIYRISFEEQATNQDPTADARANPKEGAAPLTVSFNGTRSTDPDGDTLVYTWDFGDGADRVRGATVQHRYDEPGEYEARLIVTDGNGGRDVDRILINAGSNAPEAQIMLPTTGTFYTGGQTIRFAGRAVDAEDGTLPKRAFTWKVVFHHDDHTHPFVRSVRGTREGSFKIPRGGELDPNQFYRIHLTVRDSDGLRHKETIDVRPRTTQVTLAANFEGIDLKLDGRTVESPHTFEAVVGQNRTLTAPRTQRVNGVLYEFVRWSDKESRDHDIRVRRADTTYTAIYRQVD